MLNLKKIIYFTLILLIVPGYVGCNNNNNNNKKNSLVSADASNLSQITQCAEDDNINIPIQGNVKTFLIEATHPIYDVGIDNCEPDFSNCPPPEPGYSFDPGTYKLFDDGDMIFEAVREAEWWMPNGMDVFVDNGTPVSNIHYIRLYKKVSGEDSWPQFFVLYVDGNLRLIPHPSENVSSVCFGSSVLVGPADEAQRPVAEISDIEYLSNTKTLKISYSSGGSAEINIQDVNREITRVKVNVSYSTDIPFVTFRSMFVQDGNADVDYLIWEDTSDNMHDDRIMLFEGGRSREWFFYRKTRSQHNTSAPDIRVILLN